MDALTLAGSSVLRAGDVAQSAERARQRRLRRLAVVLAVIAVPLMARALVGGVRSAGGDVNGAAAVFRWAWPHLPAGTSPYLPSALLILVLAAVLAVPLLAAGRSPHVLYRPEGIDI